MRTGFFSLFGAVVVLFSSGAVRGHASSAGRVQLPFTPAAAEPFAGNTEQRDFFVRLPGHVQFRPGSESILVLRGEPALLSLVSHISVLVNGQKTARLSLDSKNPYTALSVISEVPPATLKAGWNTLGLHFSFRPTAAANQDVLKNSTWKVDVAASRVTVAYERAELFPELPRFPESFADEKLLHGGATASPIPIMSLLVPTRLRDVPLRACAVIGARLGQLGFISDADYKLAPLEDWKREMEATSGILVGGRGELEGVNLPSNIVTRLQELNAGQGLLGEFILGDVPNQRRWLILSGADDAGLEKAVLTLGSRVALLQTPPNPAIINAAPENGESTPLANGRIRDFGQLQQLFIRDPSLRTTGFLMSRNASDPKLVVDLALHLGKQVAASPAVWPQAAVFGRSSPPDATRLANCSVLLLAPVSEWKNATTARLPLEVPASSARVVRIQGRTHEVSSFQPELALAHLLDSPWSRAHMLVAVGGWQELPARTIKSMFREAVPAGKLYGNLCAMDASGRVAVYHTQRPSVDSFADVVQRNIPEGLTREETQHQLQTHLSHRRDSAWTNRIFSYSVGGFLLALVAARLLLLWDMEWRRRRQSRREAAASLDLLEPKRASHT